MINGRTKGHSFERWIVNFFKDIFPNIERVKAGDNLDMKGVDFRETANLQIQAKRNKGYAPINKIKEVKTGTGIPILITKADREEPMVVLSLKNFKKIITDVGEVYESRD